MPRNKDIKKVLVIGSGPIVIGQAAEFDYAGTQACRSLKEEGVEVCLVNSNPATIMTDKQIADQVYIEPLTLPVLEKIILKEKPDSILPTLGGQAGLNLGMELAESGFLEEHGVKLIGTTAETIFKAEDRQAFKDTMEKIGEPCAASQVVNTVKDGIKFTNTIGYPVVLRPAFTLGGSGGGIAHNEQELVDILSNGLRLSRVGEVLVERCIAGWKEVEYEVMRDANGNCITVCNMENIDPVGVHTGDSIVVAPSQTLGDKEYQMLRSSALNIINELKITGGCNVQYALNPDSFEYCVIEVNPRVSRSSALASKATGYPIAKVTAKIALGYTLDEIKNAITQKTYASFEPMLDYCVVKIPRLPFDKFLTAKRTLSTQMKATGEVMSICDNFEGALMKAIRSLEQHVDSLMSYDFTGLSDEELEAQLHVVDDRRIWVIAEALRRGVSYDHIYEITKIDRWFIDKLAILVEMEQRLKSEELTVDLLKEAKRSSSRTTSSQSLPERPRKRLNRCVMQTVSLQHIRWWIPVPQSSPQRHRITTVFTEVRTRLQRPHRRKRFWFLVPVRSVSVRVSSLISVPYIVHGHLQRKAGRLSLSTTTRRPFPPTLILQTSCILSR